LGRTGTPDRFLVNFQADSLYARFELKAASVTNPFSLAELAQFHCPDGF
jgi:type VI secretion system protein ImpL